VNRPAPWGAIVTSVAKRQPFTVGRATVDPVSREATWPGGSERLQPQTLKVLIALVSRRGEVVTRDELVQLCWDGRIVGDDVINRSISLLRQFAEHAGGFEIETVPRAGYRLIEMPSRAARGRRGPAIAIAGVALLVLLALLGWRLETTGSAAAEPSIVLQPLTSDSADPEATKLAVATHDSIAHTLSQGPFVVKTAESAAAARSTSADFRISGQVSETPEKITISIRLEDAAHNAILFSHRFETARANALTFPEQVGAQVAAQLSWTAPLLAIERRHSSDPAAIRALFEESSTGLHGNGDLADFENARRIAAGAPNSPLAQIDLAYATAFALDSLPSDEVGGAVALGRQASDRTAALAPESGEAYAAWCMLHSEQRRVECESRLRKAIRMDPDAPFASWFLAELILNPVGRNEEAAEVAGVSLAHDPYMPAKIGLMLQMLEINGRTAEADQLYRQSLVWWPENGGIAWRRLAGIVERGDFEAAQRFEDQTSGLPHSSPVLVAINRGSLAGVHRACSKTKDLEDVICMLALARLGDADGAFAFADKLYPNRRAASESEEDRIWLHDPAPTSTGFLAGPAAAPLRRDPRFLTIAERVGLLDYWRIGRLPDFCTKAHEPVCQQIVSGSRK